MFAPLEDVKNVGVAIKTGVRHTVVFQQQARRKGTSRSLLGDKPADSVHSNSKVTHTQILRMSTSLWVSEEDAHRRQ